VSVWLYDFLANKIDWLKQDFCKYRRKSCILGCDLKGLITG
jgi:hypothetical protein